jgi:hypothetical protein
MADQLGLGNVLMIIPSSEGQQLIDRMRPARQSASSSSSDGQIGASLTSQFRNRLQWLVSTVIGCCCEQLAVLSYS